MRECKKEVLATIALSVVFCFMLFIYEPIAMYLNNTGDFWFSLSMMMGPVLVAFCLSLALLLFVSFGLLIFLKKREKNIIYDYILVIAFLVFFYCYVQGNFLSGFLPVLDGTPINWNSLFPNLISTILLLLFAVLLFVLIKKKNIQKSVNVFTWVTVAIFVMLGVSLVPMLMNQNTNIGGVSLHPTANNINNASTDKNLMILIVDAVDSRIFNERLNKNEKYKDMLDDFTYYPDTISAYPFTRESLPMLLTGEWYESQMDFDEFSTNAYNNSTFLNKMYEDRYDINLYSENIVWRKIENIELANWRSSSKIRTTSFIKQELKYILFKYLPYPLKRFSRIENFDMSVGRIAISSDDAFTPDDVVFYNNMINNMELVKQDKKLFSLIHIDGAHIPFDLDADLNWVEESSYQDEIDATIKIVAKYLERLKNNDVYDNSVIMVMADHGYNVTTAVLGRQNPILYIKGLNEHHHDMKVSDRPVSEVEYVGAYQRLLDGKKGMEAFGDSEYPKKRRYLSYLHTEVNHLIEFEQYGKAWDLTTLVPTGVEYNR